MAHLAPSRFGAPSPVHPGAGRSRALPPEPGRATELLYERHGRTVLRYAWHLLGRREDAEDASQATFLAVHRALAAGTAVLEPGAWVLRIARNECLGRLRQPLPRADPGALDELSAPSASAPERLAEVRDQMRVAKATLGALPVDEREAFVMREWLGLRTAEVALAMGLTVHEVEVRADRARRSLVLAVGGLEPAMGCAGTRAALEAGTVGRAGSVHLLRCPVCRGVRRALRPPLGVGDARTPITVVGQRLAGALPGFASGGGGIVAVLTTKAAAAPLLAKTAAIVVAALATAGVAQREIRSAAASHPVASAPARGGAAHVLAAPAAPDSTPVVPVPVTHATTASRVGSSPSERRKVQLLAVAVPAVSHVREGGARTSGKATTPHSTATAARATQPERQHVEGGGSGDATQPAGDHPGSGSVPASSSGDDHADGGGSATPKPKTYGSGKHETTQSPQASDVKSTPADGSDSGDGSSSDGSGHGGTAPSNAQPATPVAGDVSGGGDGGSGGSDGSGPSVVDPATLATDAPVTAPAPPAGD